MAKRFLETTIWHEDWFLRMPADYKLFFFWVITNYDHAGIYKPNVETYNRTNGCSIKQTEAIAFLNFEKERIRVLKNGRWLIEDFFTFQYGHSVNESNRVHLSILKIWSQNEVNMTSIRGLLDLKDGVKDKDKDKDKENIIRYGKEFKNLNWTPEQIEKQKQWYGKQD